MRRAICEGVISYKVFVEGLVELDAFGYRLTLECLKPDCECKHNCVSTLYMPPRLTGMSLYYELGLIMLGCMLIGLEG